MNFKKFLLAAAVMLAGTASQAAVTYSLNQTAESAFGAGPYGTVTLTQSFNDVLVNVTLRSDMNFVDTGTHSIFTFNLAGDSTASDVTNITFANGLGDVFLVSANQNNSPFSYFTYGIGCSSSNANPCVKGGSSGGYVDPLNFKVVNALVSDFAFMSSGSGIPAYFSADVFSNGVTATVGATVSAVPEPETYAMLLAGLGLMGTIARRRKNAA